MRITGPLDPKLAALQRMVLGALPKTTAVPVEPVVPAAPAPALVQAQASVAMLVAIAATDPESRRRRNVAAAEEGLDGLERLHRELRIGRTSAARLREIEDWMNDHAVPADRDAAALLGEVELRVLVELAKAERDR